jgi:hypothetical protein
MMKQFVILIAASLSLPSCFITQSREKKNERKDTDALHRVLAKKPLADQVYFEMAKFHPCQNVVTRYLPGRRDSIQVPVLQLDSGRVKAITDSLRTIYAEDMQQAMTEAAKAAHAECVSKYTGLKPVQVTDTVWYEDTRLINAYKFDAEAWKLKYIASQAGLDKAEKDDKGKVKVTWWQAVVFPIAFLLVGFLIGRYVRR